MSDNTWVLRLFRHPKLIMLGLSCFYLVGLLGHLWPQTRSLVLALTPFFLVISGAVLVLPSLVQAGGRFPVWFFGAWFLTYSIEVAGVASAVIFGPYHYGDTLGPTILAVPPVIGFNWVMVVLGAMASLRWLPGPKVVQALGVGCLCTLFDCVMEPVAVANGYWAWNGNSIPLQNYLAWFLIAFALSWSALRMLKRPARGGELCDHLLIFGFLAQGWFFLVQNLVILTVRHSV